ncbi:MAG: 4-hydroxythreonine-4-phosphate dehydrogenase PdxA [Elusimicrobia bacterium]|nr:4-hydroxythreonine-4-phosphate dehydrogenase PdxA [Elusimicrobiota bacterium]
MKPHILITAGDPLGIGPEIIAKALAIGQTRAAADFTVIGDTRALKNAGFKSGFAPVVPVDAASLDLNNPGPGARPGLASFKAVKLALKLLKKGAFDALVTAPVSKEAWRLAGIRHTGHTDLFRCETGLQPLMTFILGTPSGGLSLANTTRRSRHRRTPHKRFPLGPVRAALVTEHLALKQLPGKIKKDLVIAKALLFSAALKRLGIARPGIILTALNPHAGDGGLLGAEETQTLKPAIAHLRKKGLRIAGPAPTDAAWAAHLKGLADGILCLYHDQALGPLKLLPGAGRAVHWTWGLPFIRTSPAHGTAFDIAGQGVADPSSMTEALLFAAKLVLKKG